MTRGNLLKRIALETIGEEYARIIWKRIEFIGDIALIRCPLEVDPSVIMPLADEILKRFPYVKSVWAAVPGVTGEFRLRDYVWLAGEHRSETIYREHGCMFKVDFRRVYISPSLNYEHMRIARLVNDNEVVLNMFAGAGLFSIVIAKHAKPKRVFSIDINPEAYRYMVENIKLNRVEGIVIPIHGDAKDIIEAGLVGSSDRVLMPYPELALRYLPFAVKALRDGRGWVHVYLHVHTDRHEHWREKAISTLREHIEKITSSYEIICVRKIRNVGPRKHQVVIDVHVETL